MAYIQEYLAQTDQARRKPIYEVCLTTMSTLFRMVLRFILCFVLQVLALLKSAAEGEKVDLPNPASVLPFLGLYTLVNLTQEEEIDWDHAITCPHQPQISILNENGIFVEHTENPDNSDAKWIYDVTNSPHARNAHAIPLPPVYLTKYFWRLHIDPEVVLAGALTRLPSEIPCDDTQLVELARLEKMLKAQRDVPLSEGI